MITDPPPTSSTTPSCKFSGASMKIPCVHKNSVCPCKFRASMQMISFAHGPDMEKCKKITWARFVPKKNYPKKCVNCDKSECSTKQCNRPNMPKIAIKCQKAPYCAINSHKMAKKNQQKSKIATFLTFATKHRKNFTQIFHELKKKIHNHCSQACLFFHLWSM